MLLKPIAYLAVKVDVIFAYLTNFFATGEFLRIEIYDMRYYFYAVGILRVCDGSL